MQSSPENRRRLSDAFHDGEELTLGEIAQLLRVSTRTARRTIRDLQAEGVRVREQREGRHKRFSLHERDRLSRSERQTPLDFTEHELLALSVSAEAAYAVLENTTLGEALSTAFRKLLDRYEAFSFDQENVPAKWYFASVGQSQMDPDTFALVAEAVSKDRSLRISYTTLTGRKSSDRLIDPYTIAEIDGSWQVVAYCHRSDKVLQFTIAAISDAVLEDPFVHRHPEFSPDEYFRTSFRSMRGENVHTVRFTVSPDKAASFHRKMYHRTQRIEQDTPEGLVVSFEVAELDGIAPFLRSFGPGIVVTEPPEFAERLANEARQVADEYSRVRNEG